MAPEVSATMDEFATRLLAYQHQGHTVSGASSEFGVSKQDLAARMFDMTDVTSCCCSVPRCNAYSGWHAPGAPAGLCYDHMVFKRVWPRVNKSGVSVKGGAYRLKKVMRRTKENPTARDRIIAVQMR